MEREPFIIQRSKELRDFLDAQPPGNIESNTKIETTKFSKPSKNRKQLAIHSNMNTKNSILQSIFEGEDIGSEVPLETKNNKLMIADFVTWSHSYLNSLSREKLVQLAIQHKFPRARSDTKQDLISQLLQKKIQLTDEYQKKLTSESSQDLKELQFSEMSPNKWTDELLSSMTIDQLKQLCVIEHIIPVKGKTKLIQHLLKHKQTLTKSIHKSKKRDGENINDPSKTKILRQEEKVSDNILYETSVFCAPFKCHLDAAIAIYPAEVLQDLEIFSKDHKKLMTDNIINAMFANLAAQYSLNSFWSSFAIHAHTSFSQTVSQAKTHLFLPYYTGTHWLLLVYNHTTNMWNTYDSFFPTSDSSILNVRDTLTTLCSQNYNLTTNVFDHQKDSVSCGIFTCAYAVILLNDTSKEKIPNNWTDILHILREQFAKDVAYYIETKNPASSFAEKVMEFVNQPELSQNTKIDAQTIVTKNEDNKTKQPVRKSTRQVKFPTRFSLK